MTLKQVMGFELQVRSFLNIIIDDKPDDMNLEKIGLPDETDDIYEFLSLLERAGVTAHLEQDVRTVIDRADEVKYSWDELYDYYDKDGDHDED